MSFDGTDKLSQVNREAAYNAQTQDFHGNEIKFFGDFDFIPVPENRASQIRDVIGELNKMIWPTAKNLSLIQNQIDLQDRVFNRVMWYTNDANRCIKESRNVKEVNVCADSLLSNLRGKGKREVLDILKDY